MYIDYKSEKSQVLMKFIKSLKVIRTMFKTPIKKKCLHYLYKHN